MANYGAPRVARDECGDTLAVMSHAITFKVPGQARACREGAAPERELAGPTPGPARGRVKQSIRPCAQRTGVASYSITATPGEDVVVLRVEDGPELVLHPEAARDLMLAQADLRETEYRRSDGVAPPDVVQAGARLRWAGLEGGASPRTKRGVGSVVISAIEVVTGVGKEQAADLLATEVVKAIDGQVDPGVYALGPDVLLLLKGSNSRLTQMPSVADDGPLLVLIHGTFVETRATFGKLWTQHPPRVRALFERYRGHVYAFEHATLGASPIANALLLAQAAPEGARLHLLTHSRGGLVAEVLARVCADPRLTEAELLPFADGPDREALRQLAELVASRGIRVERVVRVACPARGTLLASRRLDAYLSVFKWTLELAGVPVLPALVELLHEVALRRADPAVLPGLAAMIPESPLLQWLAATETQLPGDLRVVAGDVEGDSVISWLKTLMTDAYFWTDNDLVVQTRSMYGGGPRAAGARFFLDQGGKVTHFDYFANEGTAEAIVDALIDEQPPGFRPIGPLSWAGESSSGARAPVRSDARPASERPAVLLLPGILGSNLKVGDRRIWLSWRFFSGFARLAYGAEADAVAPDGPIRPIYGDLALFLARTHELIEFAFDWRRPLEDEAERLAEAVTHALDVRSASGQPVRIVAHSMGGLLVRTMQLEHPGVWEAMMARPGARVLMLGAPNGGSWAPMQVLSGDDTFGNALAAFGSPLRDHLARQVMAGFPGFLQLQAGLLDPRRDLARSSVWQSLADVDLARMKELSWWHSDDRQLDPYRWGVPSQDVLDLAVRLRRRLDAQVASWLTTFDEQVMLVVGQAGFTPGGVEVGDAGVVYVGAPEGGDGRVAFSSACMPGVRTWQADCEHGQLACLRRAFPAYLELLERGDTARLPALPMSRGAAVAGPARRGAAATGLQSRPARAPRPAEPPSSERQLYALAEDERQTALRVTVVNGDLRLVRLPLLMGHYRAGRLTNSEAEVDRQIGGSMSAALGLGLYPDVPGALKVFVNSRRDPGNPWRPPQPAAVIVVGLGDEGKLPAAEQVTTVRKGVIEWARRLREKPAGAPPQFEIAATLIGSGGVGVSAGQSAQLVAQGVREANERLASAGWPQVEHLQLIELYHERACEAWSALQMLATASPGQYEITDHVESRPGGLLRPPGGGYRGASYDIISALTQPDGHGGTVIAFTLDTHRARTEVRAQSTQAPLLRELVAGACDDQERDNQFGRSLFQLLVPLEVEPFLGGTTELVIELDRGTADLPWELLDTSEARPNVRPWAVRTKLIRKLRETEFRTQVSDPGPDAHVLVIGEPQCDPERYPPLHGARAEAFAVERALAAPSALGKERVRLLAAASDAPGGGPDARAVVNALLERDWRVVHLAGHGELSKRPGDPHGVALSHGTFLGPREIHNLRVVPELVFVNCCYLAAIDRRAMLGPINRPKFAASIGEELIRVGVRCVVAAGWAVEDDKALVFASAFYRELVRGSRFIDAVARAREETWILGGNTWAAYQCYGDPDWTLRRDPVDAQSPCQPRGDELGDIPSSVALVLALQTLAVQSRHHGADPSAQQDRLRLLEARFAPRWGELGSVAVSFGEAWAEAGEPQAAIAWYEKALVCDDGGATLQAAEELGRLRTDRAGVAYRAGDLARAREYVDGAIDLLERVTAVGSSMRREQLCGHAYRRRAALAAEEGRDADETAALVRMREHYAKAEAFALATRSPEAFIRVLERMAAELATEAARPDWPGFDPAALSELKQSLAARIRSEPDLPSLMARAELSLYEALARNELARVSSELEGDFAKLHAQVGDSCVWRPVCELLCLVLPRYAARADTAESEAAMALLMAVETMGEKSQE